MLTHEGAKAYEHSLDHAVEFFSKAGSLMARRESFYGGEESSLSLFQKSWIADPVTSFKLLLWLRDCRGGAGNRSGAREIYRWLAYRSPEWLKLNIKWLPEVGRWDDLRVLFGTPVEEAAVNLWATAIKNVGILAAKWAKRHDVPLQRAFNTNEAGLRKILADIRNEYRDYIVEVRMCANEWERIPYEHVASVAMARYTNAFNRHDEERFKHYKEQLKRGVRRINADVLFPHDCVRTALYGDAEIADAQFDALPNYLKTDERIMVISDTSGSMQIQVSGVVRAVHISQGLALYCSAKFSPTSPFYKKFMSFSDEGTFKDWNGLTFSEAVKNREIFDGAMGHTRIDLALDLILKTAKFFRLPNSMMPTTLLIISDMQFAAAIPNGNDYDNSSLTVVEDALYRWRQAGYAIPKIVYWNTAGYAGQPGLATQENIALISGYSPAILRGLFNGEAMTPRDVMLNVLTKYNPITVPTPG